MENKYYSRLQKELEAYPYRSDYIHSVEQFNIEMPMIYGDASSVMHFFVVDRKKAIQFVKDKRINPVSIFKNKTVLAINVFEYRESAVGAFNEFTFSLPIMMGVKKSLPILPLIFDQAFSNLGFYVIQLGASNRNGRKHIEDIWGYPTYENDLTISLRREDGYVDSSIREGDKNILTMSESVPGGRKLRLQKKRFNTYFVYKNDLRRVNLNTLLFSKTWIGRRDFKITVGDHKISNILRDIGMKNKIATVLYPYAVEIAGPAQKI